MVLFDIRSIVIIIIIMLVFFFRMGLGFCRVMPTYKEFIRMKLFC